MRYSAETMHRLAKMALDSGEASSPEEAMRLFARYRIRIHLGEGWANTMAGQACLLTAVSTASRAFLGGVEVCGDLTKQFSVPLYEGRDVASVIEALGAEIVTAGEVSIPTLILGNPPEIQGANFSVIMGWDAWCAFISPSASAAPLVCSDDNPLAGIAAGALGVNEAFSFVRGDQPDAGHRTVGISLWNPLAVKDWASPTNRGPAIKYLPRSLWIIGLGHLGQAYAWTLAMLPYPALERPRLVLQDFDVATESNLSTCLLLADCDLGKKKVRLVAEHLEKIGFSTTLVERHFGLGGGLHDAEPTTALFGVDNIDARRAIDLAGFTMIVEAGLGSGYMDFRSIRTHTFPGQRAAVDVWPASAAMQKAIDLNSVYKDLAAQNNDLCGMTKLASRAVATPFVGAFAAALVLAEVIRPLHGGGIHSVLDLQMRNLRHRSGTSPALGGGVRVPYISVSEISWRQEAAPS